MRHIISFSLKEETIKKIGERTRDNSDFRSKSHLVECAVEQFLEDS